MSKIGVEGWTFHHLNVSALEKLELVQKFGADGIQFMTACDVSPSLDSGEIREFVSHAGEMGLYVECGIPRINAFRPDALCLKVGNGDYVEGLRELFKAAAAFGAAGVRTLIGEYPDRIDRGPEAWRAQLRAVSDIAKLLADDAREHGAKLAFETHTEITSFELLRLIEQVGDDAVGVCLDTGNMPVVLEDPLTATRRLLEHVVSTHLKDAVVFSYPGGLAVQPRALGSGVLPIAEILRMVRAAHPALPVSVEDHEGVYPVRTTGEGWSLDYPDLGVEEFAAIQGYVVESDTRVAKGEIPSPDALEQLGWQHQVDDRIRSAFHYVRSLEVNAA
jgi:sugar phosphate isomerase/epimerase